MSDASFTPRSVRISHALRAGVCAACVALAAGAGVLGYADWRAKRADNALIAAEATANAAQKARFAAQAQDLSGVLATGELLNRAANADLFASPPQLDRAEARTRAALARAPGKADAWVRLAQIDALRGGSLSAEAVTAVERSFYASPHGDLDLQRWRLAFAARHWEALSHQARIAALRQIETIGIYPENHGWLRSFAEGLPQGPARTAVSLAISPYD